jgi:hypothetical protein
MRPDEMMKFLSVTRGALTGRQQQRNFRKAPRSVRPLRLLLIGCEIALILGATPAHALTSRSKLEKWCAEGSAAASGRCIGYLLAAEDMLASGAIDGIRACLPEGIGLAEQIGIVNGWLRANPEADAQSAIGLVARAYAARHPCKPQAKSGTPQ